MIGPSWWLVLPLIGLGIFGRIDPSAGSATARAAVAVGGALGLLASVVGHELAHAFVAVRRSVTVERVVVFLLGGYSEMALDGSRPGIEGMIALAGPLGSAVVAAVLAGLAAAAPDVAGLAATLGLLAAVNAGVAAFNLLPVFPLDGGRLLRAVLIRAGRTPDAAQRIAAWSGVILGVVTVVLGLAASWSGLGVSVLIVPAGVGLVVIGMMGAGERLPSARGAADKI